jgi:endonuclease G, mitochondrial
LSDKDLDFALVAVKEESARKKSLRDIGWCPLIGAQGKIRLGESVNIIQHPRGEMKQIVLRENELVDLPEIPGTIAHYEGDTEPGSSGSPVFNDQWEIVALHHSGVPKMDDDGNFLDVDGDIWQKGDDSSRLAWVANEGIRVSSLVDYIASAKVREHEEELREEVLKLGGAIRPQPQNGANSEDDVGAVTVPERKDSVHSSSASSAISLQAGSVTVTIPLNITIRLGSPVVPQAAVQDSAPGEGLLEKIEPDPDYDNRPGYDPDFLGFSAPLPKLLNSIRPLAVEVSNANGGNRHELKYYHYSVIMNGKRRIAFVSAVNFDANSKVNHKREQGGDEWFFDPRVPEECQAGNEFYSRNPLDRGHLVRRADAAWGTTKAEAKLANDDTFHFTNCSPQHEVFNQSTKANKKGLLLWGNLEEHIVEQARADKKKLCIFNGPVFRANDRKLRGLQLPQEFWKIVVLEKENREPTALAFLLSQASLIKDLPEEEFEVGPYGPFQVRVREIEDKTKLDFGKLRTFDPLEQEENEGFFETGTQAVPLRRLEDIIV